MDDWFTRPVLHVADVEASLLFYVTQLGFSTAWRRDDGGKARAAQVERNACVIILSDTWTEKIGNGTLFISLNLEPQAQIHAVDKLRVELETKSVPINFPVKGGRSGYRLLVVNDPDGNQLYFNYPSEATATP